MRQYENRFYNPFSVSVAIMCFNGSFIMPFSIYKFKMFQNYLLSLFHN